MGWKYFLVIICWCLIFIPSEFLLSLRAIVPDISSVIYFYFPETARLTLEEISQKFGDDVAVHITDASQEERDRLEKALERGEDVPTAVTVTGEKAA